MDDPDTKQSESKRITTYDLLMRQSRKLGGAATQALDGARNRIKKYTNNSSQTHTSNTDTETKTKQDSANTQRKSPVERAESLLFGKKADQSSHSVSAKEAKAIRRVVRQSHEILAAAKTVLLPVNLFPDTITVDRTKVTITRRTFFWTSEVITMRIDDILAVTSNFGPFFGSLKIATRIMNSTDHYEVHYFWRKDAEYIKQLIQGYVIAQHNEIETKHLSTDELIETLLELGRDSQF